MRTPSAAKMCTASYPSPAQPANEMSSSASLPGAEKEHGNTPAPPKAPVDPRIAAVNARSDELENLDYEGRIELFLSTLGDKQLMDAETAFDSWPGHRKVGKH
jgi:hypothetical protein